MAYPRDNGQYERFCRWRESHINYYAVQALLARVYWYMGNNAKAAEYAEKVINSNLFPLVDVTEVQNRIAGVLSPKETIFGLYSQQYLEWSSTYLYTWQSYVSYIAYDNSGGTNYLMPWSALYALDLAGTEQDFRKNHFRVESSLGKMPQDGRLSHHREQQCLHPPRAHFRHKPHQRFRALSHSG